MEWWGRLVTTKSPGRQRQWFIFLPCWDNFPNLFSPISSPYMAYFCPCDPLAIKQSSTAHNRVECDTWFMHVANAKLLVHFLPPPPLMTRGVDWQCCGSGWSRPPQCTLHAVTQILQPPGHCPSKQDLYATKYRTGEAQLLGGNLVWALSSKKSPKMPK